MASRLTSLAPAFALPASIGSASGWRQWRVAIAYRWRHGRWPDLDHPRRFTEWVQWRKLHDRDLGLARLTDKLHSKAFAVAVLGESFTIPTLWHGTAPPVDPPAPFPLVVKSNHGCGQWRVVTDLVGWERVRRLAPKWIRTTYGKWLDEWHYEAATPGLLVEPYIGEPGVLPIDYKIYVFAGRAAVVQVHEGRGHAHRWAQYDRDWRMLSRHGVNVARPVSLERMMAAAEALSQGRDFIRIDFYEVGGQPLFGEFCLYPGSGLDPFDPSGLDDRLGELWSAARS